MEYKKVYRKRCPDYKLEATVEEIINHGGTIIKIFEIHYGYDDWMILYYMSVEGRALESGADDRADSPIE